MQEGRSQSYKYNMLCGMEQDPLQKDKMKKRGKKRVDVALSAPARSTLWPLDDTSHQQSAAYLFTDIQPVRLFILGDKN